MYRDIDSIICLRDTVSQLLLFSKIKKKFYNENYLNVIITKYDLFVEKNYIGSYFLKNNHKLNKLNENKISSLLFLD